MELHDKHVNLQGFQQSQRYLFAVHNKINRLDISQLVLSYSQPLIRRYFTMITEYRYQSQFKNKQIHPRQRYYTRPDTIQKLIAPEPSFSVANSGEIHGGQWDTEAEDFDEYRIYHSLKKQFERGWEWDRTRQLEHAKQLIRSGESCWHGCSSMQDLRSRCSYLDDLYKTIKENGYTPQSELTVDRGENASFYPPTLREISVAVGRDGDLVLLDGRHRLSIAKILDIDQIPIQIAVVHAEWDGGLPEDVSHRKSHSATN